MPKGSVLGPADRPFPARRKEKRAVSPGAM
jgi:hypothetical protein